MAMGSYVSMHHSNSASEINKKYFPYFAELTLHSSHIEHWNPQVKTTSAGWLGGSFNEVRWMVYWAWFDEVGGSL